MIYKNSINAIKNHPVIKKSFDKLNSKELLIVNCFFERKYESKNEAMILANRLFLDKERTRNWTSVIEVISSVIFHHFEKL